MISENTSNSSGSSFLSDGGEMGRLIRSYNWENTNLGSPDRWPQSLKTTLSIILNSKFPMFLWWGPDMICFYNDAYRPSLGTDGKHPSILGSTGAEAWPEIWEIIKPLIEGVYAGGESTWSEDRLIPIFRNGKIEDVYWTFSYSPVKDEEGGVAGVLVTCTETTHKVLAFKELANTEAVLKQKVAELASSEARFRFLVKGAPVAISVLTGSEFVVESANDLILKIWGKSSDVIGKKLVDALPELKGQAILKILEDVYVSRQAYSGREYKVLLEHDGGLKEFYFDFIYQPLYDNSEVGAIMAVAVDVTNQILAKRELEAAYEKIRLSKQAAELGTFDLDLINDTMDWDDRCRELFGIDHQEVVTYENDFLMGLHPDDRDNVLSAIDITMVKAISNGDYDIEYRTVGKKDQRIRWVRAIGKVYFNEEDCPVRFIGSVFDVTYRKLNEIRSKENAERQARLAAIVNSSDDAIISKTLGGIITTWNPAAERMFGYTESEALGKHISLIIPQTRLYEDEFIIEKIKNGGKIKHFETLRIAKDGSEIPLSLSVSPIINSDGSIIGASKIARDISDQHAANKAARRYVQQLEIMSQMLKIVSEELDLNKILQKITDATTILTGAKFGAFFYRNANGQDEPNSPFTLSGGSKEAFEKFILSRNSAGIYPSLSGDQIVRIDDISKAPYFYCPAPNKQLKEDYLEIASYLTVPVISRAGSVIGCLFYGHPEPSMFTKEHEDLVSSIATQSAIGIDNASLYEEIKALNAKKDEFIGLASHELKTPLTCINVYLQIISKLMQDSKSKQLVDKTLQQVNKLSLLVNDLLDVSKIEAGQMKFTIEKFDLRRTIEDAIDLIRHTTNKFEIILETDIKTCEIEADNHRIEQVLINLLNNAIKYSPGANKVLLSLTCTETEATVSVRDFGFGIPSDKLKDIFSRFYRIEEDVTNISGLGMGLFLSYEIITRHRGKLWAESEKGAGSTFYFTLPI